MKKSQEGAALVESTLVIPLVVFGVVSLFATCQFAVVAFKLNALAVSSAASFKVITSAVAPLTFAPSWDQLAYNGKNDSSELASQKLWFSKYGASNGWDVDSNLHKMAYNLILGQAAVMAKSSVMPPPLKSDGVGGLIEDFSNARVVSLSVGQEGGAVRITASGSPTMVDRLAKLLGSSETVMMSASVLIDGVAGALAQIKTDEGSPAPGVPNISVGQDLGVSDLFKHPPAVTEPEVQEFSMGANFGSSGRDAPINDDNVDVLQEQFVSLTSGNAGGGGNF